MRTARQAVLDGVVMDVVDVVDQVVLVADRMLPETLLPDAAFTMASSRLGDGRLAAPAREPELGEQHFDACPANGEVAVALRELPDAVQMLGQQDDRGDLERVTDLDLAHGGPQGSAGWCFQQDRASPLGYHREEEHASGLEQASIVRHRNVRMCPII